MGCTHLQFQDIFLHLFDLICCLLFRSMLLIFVNLVGEGGERKITVCDTDAESLNHIPSQGHTGTDMNVWTLTLGKWQMSCGPALTSSEDDGSTVTQRWALITHHFKSVFSACKKQKVRGQLHNSVWRGCVCVCDSLKAIWQQGPGWHGYRLITVWDDCFELLRVTKWKITLGVMCATQLGAFSLWSGDN